MNFLTTAGKIQTRGNLFETTALHTLYCRPLSDAAVSMSLYWSLRLTDGRAIASRRHQRGHVPAPASVVVLLLVVWATSVNDNTWCARIIFGRVYGYRS